MTFKTESAVRAAFWQGWQDRPQPRRLPSGDWPADVRVEFCDFVEMLVRDDHISEELAQRVTL